MKLPLTITLILLFNLSFAFAQDESETAFLATKSKWHPVYYVQMKGPNAVVYAMGFHLDKAGSGFSLRNTDTLLRQNVQGNQLYAGSSTKIISENHKFYLVTQEKKNSKLLLETTNQAYVHTNLNNGYYLDHFFAMCDELNKKYPLHDYSWRNGFRRWENLQNKEMDHLQFRTYADKQLKLIKDSVSLIHDEYSALTNSVLENIKSIDYNSLKDSLNKLPTEYPKRYFGRIVFEVSIRRPADFFRLAEDLPTQKDRIFWAADDSKDAVKRLKAVENHDQIKKEFIKERNFNKSMPFKIIGVYAAVAGLITLLIVSQ